MMDKKFDINEYTELAAKRLFWDTPDTSYFRGFLMGMALVAAKEYQIDEDFAYLQLRYSVRRYWDAARIALQDELLSYKPKEWESPETETEN